LKKGLRLFKNERILILSRGKQPNDKPNNQMTKNEILAALKQAGINRDNHNATYNEGATDGFNPHEDKIAELAEKLSEITKKEKEAILSGDSLKSEKAWFNAQGFRAANVAQAACLERGYTVSELMSAAKAAK